MIGLFTFGLRVVLLAGFTFAFVVLFEHGPQGFSAGAPVEAKHFQEFVVSLMNRKAVEPEPAPVAPASEVEPAASTPAPVPQQVTSTPTPKPKNPPSAWEKLQSTPIGEGMDLPISGSTN